MCEKNYENENYKYEMTTGDNVLKFNMRIMSSTVRGVILKTHVLLNCCL